MMVFSQHCYIACTDSRSETGEGEKDNGVLALKFNPFIYVPK